MKGWQRRQGAAFGSRAKEQAKRSLHHFGHGAALARSFALELGHHTVVDVECGLHMSSHIISMVIWSTFGGTALRARDGSSAAASQAARSARTLAIHRLSI